MIRLDERGILGNGYLPIYGIGHSMGCKLHLLIGSRFPKVERAGNIFISFNNYAARDAVPFIEQFNTAFTNSQLAVEFVPSPAQTNDLVREYYNVRRNLLIKFTSDTIDQSVGLSEILRERFNEMVTMQIIAGNHLTPLGQDVKWQAGRDFNPLDAIGQWFKQEVYRDLNLLKSIILLWLNPVFPPV